MYNYGLYYYNTTYTTTIGMTMGYGETTFHLHNLDIEEWLSKIAKLSQIYKLPLIAPQGTTVLWERVVKKLLVLTTSKIFL